MNYNTTLPTPEILIKRYNDLKFMDQLRHVEALCIAAMDKQFIDNPLNWVVVKLPPMLPQEVYNRLEENLTDCGWIVSKVYSGRECITFRVGDSKC